MRSRIIYAAAVLLLIAAMLAIRIADPAPIARLRLLAFDTFQLLAPRTYDPDLPVRIVDIDDSSLTRIGQWPWPRTVLADLTRILADNGAAAIAYDIVMPEPETLVADSLRRRLPKDPDVDAFLERIKQLPSSDEAFADAIAKAPVVLGFIGSDKAASPPNPKAGFAFAGDDPAQFTPRFKGAVISLPALQANAQGTGALNWVPELDQIIRRVPLLLRVGDGLFPSLALEGLRVGQGASTLLVKSSGASGEESFGAKTGIVAVKAGAVEIPTDGSGQLWIRFSRTNPRRYISAADLLDGKVDKSEIEGRIMLVGTSAAGLFDLRTTPLDSAVPGVEVHAQAIEQMLTGGHLRRPDFAPGAELAFLAIAGILVATAVYVTGAMWSAAIGIATLVGAVGSSWAAYQGFGWLLDPVYPALALTLLYIATTVYLYLRTEGERRRVRNTFNHYMAPELVEQLCAHPDRLKLGGEIREVTLLFCDVRGFTSISERLDAEQLTRFLNRLLTPLSDAIMANRGYIDKYMGDAIMAFWNAPLDDPDHARNACRAALAMLTEVERLNGEWKSEAEALGQKHIPVRIGIGLNTAHCCVGNFGSDRRLSYSVIGDGVNVASRLEGRSKNYGMPVVLGEATAALAPDFSQIEIDFVSVHGRAEPLHVFGLLDESASRTAEESKQLQLSHAAMLEAFRSRRFAEAATDLQAARAAGGPMLGTLYDLYADRIQEYTEMPPPADWDGRMIAEGK